jgi:5'-phosphate synthase pdxT subunit
VRSPAELAQCQALVIPGGESTVIHSVAERTPGMLPALLDFVRDPERAVWGTCAGMILMAEEDGVGGGKVIPGRAPQRGWGGIEGLRVWRNLYGSELLLIHG